MGKRGIEFAFIMIVTLMVALAGRVAFRLGFLHLANHSRIDRSIGYTIPAPRGHIYDANGNQYPLAVSIPEWRYHIDPQSINLKEHTPEGVARTVADALKLDYDEVLAKFKRTDSRYIPLARSLDDAAHMVISDPKCVSGISIEQMMTRRYPHGQTMAHVLGFVNAQGIGSAGLEIQYNRYLTGIAGKIEGVRDARRREIFTKRTLDTAPVPGSDVYLTLDHNIQYEVENVLQETVEKFNAEAGWAIVMRVKTGAILAMASYPTFEPERYNETTAEVWRNNAVAITYEPGSVMKAITVAAALNERIVDDSTMFDVGSGAWFYAGRVLRDHVQGSISVATALAKSSNIACAKMGLMLGNDRLNRYFRAFNFGARIGIELPGEEAGIFPRPRDWSKLTPTRITMGQGLAVTALQMVNAYATLANDGVMVKPYLVEKIVSASGEPIYTHRKEIIGRPLRPAVARKVCQMLTGVTTTGGTGTRAAIPGYSVAGKTGTAQKVVNRVYSESAYYASFVGIVPASAPEIVVLVSIDHPQPQHTGSFVAAPAFARIASYVLRYLTIAPDRPEEVTPELSNL